MPLRSPHCIFARLAAAMSIIVAVVFAADARAQESYLGPPIHYNTAPTTDPIALLQQRLDAGEATLKWDEKHGYLPAILDALGIPHSSQVLVFSKTSLQRSKISPSTPRAIYFDDDNYIGWCLNGDVVEISTVDPTQGAIFYTLAQKQTPADRVPRIVRDRGQCLSCHDSARTAYVPGHLVRSVYVDERGLPVPGTSTYTINHTSPIAQRFGGWYVTGTHGEMRHLGNVIVTDRYDPEKIDDERGANYQDLSSRFDTSAYLTPHSDMVALMVLDHQARMHNLIARANYETRIALHQQAEMNRALKEPTERMRESTQRRIESVAEPLLKYMLFVDEAALTDPVKGTSTFARDFAARGLRDAKGRSLRDFDLHRWLFQYPCSYLIYCEAWDNLPDPMLTYLYQRLWTILHGQDTSGVYDMLSTADRQAILTILRETKKGLPDDWMK